MAAVFIGITIMIEYQHHISSPTRFYLSHPFCWMLAMLNPMASNHTLSISSTLLLLVA
jgi:hypothetical protein